jgi:endonuclease III
VNQPRSLEARRERAAIIVRALRRDRPDARVELDHRNPFELLVATILSAQCTDARVNLVTPALFERWPTPAALAQAEPEDLEPVIRSTGFFRAKARSLVGCARAIVERHESVVPRTLEALAALPGVGRKTANVVLGAGYGIPSGIVIDTHMGRVARRLGLTRQEDPVRVESDLMAVLPQSDWIFLSIAGVLHGRYVCLARAPRCEACALSAHCPSRGRVAAVRPRPRRGRDRGRS